MSSTSDNGGFWSTRMLANDPLLNTEGSIRNWSELSSRYKMRLTINNLSLKTIDLGYRFSLLDNTEGWYFLTGKIESLEYDSDNNKIITAVILCNDERIHPIIYRGYDNNQLGLIPADVTTAEELLLIKEMQAWSEAAIYEDGYKADNL